MAPLLSHLGVPPGGGMTTEGSLASYLQTPGERRSGRAVRAESVLERSVKGLCHLCLPSHVVSALSLSRQSGCPRAGVGGRRAPGPPGALAGLQRGCHDQHQCPLELPPPQQRVVSSVASSRSRRAPGICVNASPPSSLPPERSRVCCVIGGLGQGGESPSPLEVGSSAGQPAVPWGPTPSLSPSLAARFPKLLSSVF